jgi:hypothetical protein
MLVPMSKEFCDAVAAELANLEGLRYDEASIARVRERLTKLLETEMQSELEAPLRGLVPNKPTIEADGRMVMRFSSPVDE